MAKQIVLIKASFLVSGNAFSHFSQLEKSLSDFFYTHGVEMKRVRVLGVGDGDSFYTIEPLDIVETPQDKRPQPKPVNVQLKEVARKAGM